MAWLNRLENELDNLRAALEYSQAGRASEEAEAGLRLVVALEHVLGHPRALARGFRLAGGGAGAPQRAGAQPDASIRTAIGWRLQQFGLSREVTLLGGRRSWRRALKSSARRARPAGAAWPTR